MTKSKLLTMSAAILACLSSLPAYAQTPRELIEKARQVERLISQRANQLDQRVIIRLIGELEQVERLALGHGPGPGPGPGPWPPQRQELQATCHIDDDNDFNFDQSVAGQVRGLTVEQLIADCRALSQAAYGARGTSGIKGLQVLNAPRDAVLAECHIDDDTDFSFDQLIIGQVTGSNFVDTIRQCRTIAASVFGPRGSAGVKHRGFISEIPHLVTGTCHLDDDRDFSRDQHVFGTLRGRSVQEVVSECAQLAEATFGANSSSGVFDVRQPR